MCPALIESGGARRFTMSWFPGSIGAIFEASRANAHAAPSRTRPILAPGSLSAHRELAGFLEGRTVCDRTGSRSAISCIGSEGLATHIANLSLASLARRPLPRTARSLVLLGNRGQRSLGQRVDPSQAKKTRSPRLPRPRGASPVQAQSRLQGAEMHSVARAGR